RRGPRAAQAVGLPLQGGLTPTVSGRTGRPRRGPASSGPDAGQTAQPSRPFTVRRAPRVAGHRDPVPGGAGPHKRTTDTLRDRPTTSVVAHQAAGPPVLHGNRCEKGTWSIHVDDRPHRGHAHACA